jgi:tetratricopeptide (TPR) repeat protein
MTLIVLAAALAAAAQAAPSAACPKTEDAAALTCRAVAAQSEGSFETAASAFEQLAGLLPEGDPRRARALAAAGNMWIAANQPGKAALALDKALTGTGLQAEQRGEALLDRARAAEAQNDLKTARAKVTEAAQTIGQQPFLWYFSAALAIREGNAAEARSSINRALSLAPNDPLMLFEAGHVAQFEGNLPAARAYWTRAAELDPNGASGKAAKDAVALLDSPATASQPQPRS